MAPSTEGTLSADPRGNVSASVSHLAVPGSRVDGVVETGLASQAEDLLQEELGVVLEDGVDGEVKQVCVLFALVVTEVDEVFYVVVGPDVLDVLKGGGERTCKNVLSKWHAFCDTYIVKSSLGTVVRSMFFSCDLLLHPLC